MKLLETETLQTKRAPEITKSSSADRFQPLLALAGTGREIWKDQHGDEYVAELRGRWAEE